MVKNFTPITLLILLYANCFSQISTPNGELRFEDTLSLDPLHGWFSVPSPTENIWQVGMVNKSFFNETLSGKPAFVTDTINTYPKNIDNHFFLSIPAEDSSWYEGILSFYHKFNTDTLADGGLIEVSYDQGQTWKNILDDKNHISTNFIGLYTETDTIIGNNQAFSGTIQEWSYVELHWVWVALTKSGNEAYGLPIVKFKFLSDSISSDKDGWLIDNIVFRGYDISGSTGNLLENEIYIFPNPATDLLSIHIGNNHGNCIVKIYSIDGRLKIQEQIESSKSIDITTVPKGIYLLQIFKNDNLVGSKKLIRK